MHDDWGWRLLGQSLSLMPDGGKALATSVPSYCSPVVVGLSQLSTEKLQVDCVGVIQAEPSFREPRVYYSNPG